MNWKALGKILLIIIGVPAVFFGFIAGLSFLVNTFEWLISVIFGLVSLTVIVGVICWLYEGFNTGEW